MCEHTGELVDKLDFLDFRYRDILIKKYGLDDKPPRKTKILGKMGSLWSD